MNRLSEHEVLEDFEHRAREILGTSDVEITDGRVALRLRNREKILDALIALVLEGSAGTIDEIVERSGVARRSIFRHFADVADLLIAAMRRVVAEATKFSILEDPGVGPLDRRIELFVDARLNTVAVMHPFRSRVHARLAGTETVKAGLLVSMEMLREQIARQFDNELKLVATGDLEQLIDTIYMVTSYESYDVSVGQLGRSVDAVRTSWIRTISLLLAV